MTPAPPQVWWCEQAVLPEGLAAGVTVSVKQGRIVRVEAASQPGPTTTRLRGLTVPGFANAHSHAFHRALRGRVQAERGTFWTWREVMYRAAARLEPDSYHRLARAVFGEMALAGMSVVGEFHYVHHRPDGTPYAEPNAMGEALIAAAAGAGIRITLLDTIYLHGGLDSGGHLAPGGAQLRYTDGSFERWAERVDQLRESDRHRVGAAVHSVRAVDPAAIGKVASWALGRSAPVHLHVSEQVEENEQSIEHLGATPIGVLAEAGALGSNVTAVHATHPSAADIELLASAGTSVCLCPTTEQDLGDGVGPAHELVTAGISICLGSDSHATIDHLVEARTVELQDRARLQHRGVHDASALLAMATDNGHSSLGWPDAGSIAIGRRADLTAIGLDGVRTAGAPTERSVEAVMFAATTADITDVIIDGEHVVAEGRHRSIDVAAELATCIEGLFA